MLLLIFTNWRKGNCTHSELEEMLKFLQNDLSCEKHDVASLNDTALADYLYKKLNRPMRVCGMVKNVGEPGGGPFLAYNQDGIVSLQILESSQMTRITSIYEDVYRRYTLQSC